MEEFSQASPYLPGRSRLKKKRRQSESISAKKGRVGWTLTREFTNLYKCWFEIMFYKLKIPL
jgi:hypothetical protein